MVSGVSPLTAEPRVPAQASREQAPSYYCQGPTRTSPSGKAAASHTYVARHLVCPSVPQSDYLLLASSTSRSNDPSHDNTSSARPSTLPHLRLRPRQELDHRATRPQTEMEVHIPVPVKEFIREREVCLDAAIFASIPVRVEEKLRNGQTGKVAWHTYWRHIGDESPSASS